jgi:hypothetical protein
MKRPTHRTPSAAMRREERIRHYLTEMSDVPVPRPHAGKKSKRKLARLWEYGSAHTGMNRATRRSLGIR